jgi:hypothetical protein
MTCHMNILDWRTTFLRYDPPGYLPTGHRRAGQLAVRYLRAVGNRDALRLLGKRL